MEILVNTPIVPESARKRKKKAAADSPEAGKTKGKLIAMPKPRKPGESRPEKLRRLADVVARIERVLLEISYELEIEAKQ